MSKFCKAKPGDMVYGIPERGKNPEGFFLMLDGNKVIAVNSKGDQQDFNPEEFCSTSARAKERAVEREWNRLTTEMKNSYRHLRRWESESEYKGRN